MVTKVSFGIVSGVPSGTRRAGQSARATTIRLSMSTHTEAFATTTLVFDVGVNEADLTVDTLFHHVDFSTGEDRQTVTIHQQLDLVIQLVMQILRSALLHHVDDIHEAGTAALLDADPHGLARLAAQLAPEVFERSRGDGKHPAGWIK